jgi:hypothetical protein
VGSAVATPCAPGTVNPRERQETCERCVPGTYQDLEGNVTCKVCTRGYYCAEGSAAPLPCRGGTRTNSSLTRAMESDEDCVSCGVGKFCPVGSDVEINCAPGTYNALERQQTCESCSAGTFQDLEGNHTCKRCTPGYYCAKGSSAPLPCPSGTRNNSSLTRPMTSEDDCVICAVGTFCPVGSDVETPCAPGTVNPLERQETCVRCTAGTFQDLEGSVACKACRAGYYCAEGSSTPLPCLAGSFSNRTDLHRVDQCLPTPPGFFTGIGRWMPEACGVGTFAEDMGSTACQVCSHGTYSSASAVTACTICSPGYWCSRDDQIACAESTYNPNASAFSITQCKRCPERTSTNGYLAATSVANCSCSVDYYLAPDWMDVSGMSECRERCCICPVGANCADETLLPMGERPLLPITLDNLPVDSGYFRLAAESDARVLLDVRRCPDSSAGCRAGESVCASGTSGCKGGRNPNDLCREGLDGIFCRRCMEEDTYYVEAEDSEYAHCAPCADAVSSGAKSTVGVCVIVLLVLVSVGAAAFCCIPKRMERLWTSMFAVIEEYTLGNKLKILIGYYMIATRVEHVYEVFLPAEVRGLLKQIRIVISLGIESIPLRCVGANGYVKRLLFWMITPLVLVLSAPSCMTDDGLVSELVQ